MANGKGIMAGIPVVLPLAITSAGFVSTSCKFDFARSCGFGPKLAAANRFRQGPQHGNRARSAGRAGNRIFGNFIPDAGPASGARGCHVDATSSPREDFGAFDAVSSHVRRAPLTVRLRLSFRPIFARRSDNVELIANGCRTQPQHAVTRQPARRFRSIIRSASRSPLDLDCPANGPGFLGESDERQAGPLQHRQSQRRSIVVPVRGAPVARWVWFAEIEWLRSS